jgi:phosphoribosylglycinamide formyltransferase-1
MTHNPPRIKFAIFFSGWGRSVTTCLDIFLSGKVSPAEIACAVTIGQSSEVINRIKSLGIKTIEEDPLAYESPALYQEELASRLQHLKIDYIFMLGYKYRIREPLLKIFPNRILNIHPSLLPAFKNTQSAIQDAMAYGVKITGITTHIIDEEIDEGTILCQG